MRRVAIAPRLCSRPFRVSGGSPILLSFEGEIVSHRDLEWTARMLVNDDSPKRAPALAPPAATAALDALAIDHADELLPRLLLTPTAERRPRPGKGSRRPF